MASRLTNPGVDSASSPDRDRLSLVLENLGDPVIVTDHTGSITLLGPISRKLFGADRPGSADGFASNRTRLQRYLTTFASSVLEQQDKAISVYDPELHLEVQYSAHSSKIYDGNGRCAHTVTVLKDAATSNEAERLHLQRRMMEMEKFAATGKLAGTIAHEINNPMEAIKNAVYLLKDRVDPGSRPIYEALKSETDRVTRIVRQMLGLYRNAGAFGSFDLNGVIEDTLALFSRPLQNSKVVVDKRLGNLPTIKGSADQFRQLLSNLVVNAADSMPSGGKMTIRTRYIRSRQSDDGQCTLIVADTGGGIPPEVRPTIFDPFVSTKGEKGTGLGLWIVKGIVEGHGGRILVRSSMGRGTIFKIIIPVSKNN
jgi:signal transduction histidine kinase